MVKCIMWYGYIDGKHYQKPKAIHFYGFYQYFAS